MEKTEDMEKKRGEKGEVQSKLVIKIVVFSLLKDEGNHTYFINMLVTTYAHISN